MPISTTPQAWTKGALRSHLGVSYQTFDRLRAAMLATVGPGGDQTRLGDALMDLAEHIAAETDWLASLQPLPTDMRVRPRAVYLAEYGNQLIRASRTLTEAAKPPTTPDRFEPFGLALLQVMAHLKAGRDI